MTGRLTYVVGVTSAPRPRPTLPATLDSLAAAGWTDPIVFYDAERRGPWWNFKRAFWSLKILGGISGAPRPDLILIVEDDVQITPGLRWWLDESLPRTDDVFSLYSSASVTGVAGYYPNWWRGTGRGNGALAILLPYSVSIPLIDPIAGDRRTDAQIAAWCGKRGPHYLFHSPSFVRHTGGGNSSLRSPCGDESTRQCAEFVKEIKADGSFETVKCGP